MPTFTLRTKYFDIEECAKSIQPLCDTDHIIDMLMYWGIPGAIQYAFKEELGRDFGFDKITKQLDTSTWLFDPKILVLVECHDRDNMDVDKKHTVEECIALWLHHWLMDVMTEYFGGNLGLWGGMPLIDVRLDPKPYSVTVVDVRGGVIQQVPKRLSE